VAAAGLARTVRHLTGLSGFLLQGPIDSFTQNRTSESPVFYSLFILTSLTSSSMAQHLATSNKFVFTTGGFWGTKVHHIAHPDLLVDWGG